MRDYERQLIVEKGGKLSDSEDENWSKQKSRNPTYVQEQNDIKESLKKAVQEDEDDEDLLLKPKAKTNEESKKVILNLSIVFINEHTVSLLSKIFFSGRRGLYRMVERTERRY